jgi:hypothetical protein
LFPVATPAAPLAVPEFEELEQAAIAPTTQSDTAPATNLDDTNRIYTSPFGHRVEATPKACERVRGAKYEVKAYPKSRDRQ